MMRATQRHVLQFCHGYEPPFLDCARQYASLFADTRYRVTTVFLTGAADANVAAACASDEVLFLQYSSKAVRGLKLGAINAVRKIAASRDFSFCIAQRFKPIYIALLATGLPVIGVHHGFADYQRFTRKRFAHLFHKRLSLLGVSDAVRDDIRRCLPTWPKERIATLYNRVDIATLQAQQLSAADARARLGLAADAWVLGNVSRLHPDKDQATLLRGFAAALPSLPANSQLAILGGGRLEQPLKKLASELNIADRLRFFGHVADARLYFRAFDVFALSSDHEPFGMVLLEAMAAGVPLLATDCGGAREVVGGVGVLFPLRDVQRLAQGLQLLAAMDEQQRQLCATRMRERLAQRFSDRAVRAAFWRLPQVIDLAARA